MQPTSDSAPAAADAGPPGTVHSAGSQLQLPASHAPSPAATACADNTLGVPGKAMLPAPTASNAAAGTSAAPAAGGATPTEEYGAAAASLRDPACTPGTQEFAAAKEANSRVLEKYRAIMMRYEGMQQAKPDMKAAAETRDAAREGRYGHLPGLAVRDEFVGRGELAALGLHSQMMQGINCSKKGSIMGAYAICLSGGYKDDDDDGHSFWYTGAGGQKGKKTQVEDQTYTHSDNAALLRNYQTGTPVRVFRAKVTQQVSADGSKGRALRLYVYEGLYQVVEHRQVPSQDGPLVVQFMMQGVPGHSAVSGKVEYMCLARVTGLKRVTLAGRAGRPAKRRRRAPSSYQFDFTIPSPADVKLRISERQAAGTYGRLVTPDVAGGLERVPIAMWNDLDADDTITTGCAVTGELMPDDEPFKYQVDYIFGEQEAKDQAVLAEQHFRSHFPHLCGMQYHGGVSCYTQHKQLKGLEPCGVMECDPGCEGPTDHTAANTSSDDNCTCKGNSVLSDGIIYPLEVFKVAGKGWGVRCSVDVPVGAVLCTYIGTIITDSTAERLKDMDTYLFNLDHFHCLQWEEEEEQKQQQQQQQDKAKSQEDSQSQGPPAQQQQQQQQQQKPPQQLQSDFDGVKDTSQAAGGHQQQQQQQQRQSGSGGGKAAKRSSDGQQQQQQQGDVDAADGEDYRNPNLPPIHPDMKDVHLVVDASHEGNVGRFINHSCDPNCLVQPVMARSARSHFLYYIAVVAAEDIPAFTELTYNYSYQHPPPAATATTAAAAAGCGASADAGGSCSGRKQRLVPCRCGAANCCQWLLTN